MSRPALRHSGQMRRLSICFIACLSRGVSGLDCSGIRDCGTCAVARQGFDQCGWCGTGSKGSCAKAGPAALGPKEGKCDRQCWFSGSIDAGKCPGSCEGSTCSECVASKNCMWCASTQTCGAKVGAFGDMCVGQKAVSCKSDQCAKSRDSEYCPKVSCSSLTKCNSCAQEPGCAWDAKNLKCVERARSSFIKACPSSDADEHCLISSSDKCPSTASGLCSEYKDDLKACLKDPACGWSTELSDRDVVGGSCVEANVPFSACRGGDVFSYFDAEPHCNVLRNCSVCIAEEHVSCTWCSGELFDDYTPRSSRCVLSRGAMGGMGDRSAAAHRGHSCAALSDTSDKCNHCSQFSTCDDCIKDPGCGACLASSGQSSCVEGDRHERFVPCQMQEPMKFWAHEGAGSGQGPQCTNRDVCRKATSCLSCQALQVVEGLDCVWCNNSVPLQSAPPEGAPCQRRDLCPAQSRHPDGKCAPSMLAPLCSSYTSCSECIAQHSCGWAHKNGCVRSSRAYSTSFLPYVWGDAEKCPETCGSHKDSTSCTKHSGCGWCSFSGACFPGDSSGPDYAATGKQCTPWCYGKQPCSSAGGLVGGFLGFLAALMKIIFVLALVALGAVCYMRRREVRGFISRFRQGDSSSTGEIALGRL